LPASNLFISKRNTEAVTALRRPFLRLAASEGNQAMHRNFLDDPAPIIRTRCHGAVAPRQHILAESRHCGNPIPSFCVSTHMASLALSRWCGRRRALNWQNLAVCAVSLWNKPHCCYSSPCVAHEFMGTSEIK